MSFTRTDSGISNLHIFLGVDCVVYVEGGKSYNYEEVAAGGHSTESFDIQFWQSIFKIFKPSLRCTFRAIGSKLTLLLLAEKIRSGEISNIYVAMDRDFDNYKGSLINAKNVLYTFGYSWENDACQLVTIEEAFYMLCPLCRQANNVHSLISTILNDCEQSLRWPVYADLLLCLNESSLFPRDHPESIISILSNNRPAVNRVQLSTLIASKKHLPLSVKIPTGLRLKPLVDCFGHLMFCYSYRIITYFIKTFTSMSSLPKDYATAALIRAFSDKLGGGQLPELYRYYNAYFVS